jgi:hypothetical protein
MANAAQASAYELFEIQKNGKRVDITGQDPYGARVTSFDYYESLLSPNITAVLSLMDVGGATTYDKTFDKQTRFGTLSSALPLNGDVNVSFKIRSKLGTLDFTNNPLVFDKQINPNQESNREAIVMNLVSKSAVLNQETAIFKPYSGNITNTVEKLVADYLKTKLATKTPTRNSYSFIGNTRHVFDVICSLASKSVPGRGNPGYFFYETRDGFNFRAIDDLVSQPPVETYYRTDVLRSGVENDENDFKIALKSDIKREDLITALKSGVYQSRNIFWDPQSFSYEEGIYKLTDNGLEKSLGKNLSVPQLDSYTRTHFHIKDIGVLSSKIKDDPNNDPKEWQAKSTMRYNLLFTQIIQVQVPCNPNLRAGNTIQCDFEIVSQGKKTQGVGDPVNSGKYLIVNLCHHFDPLRSFTSMTLVRDTYGLYTNKSK